MECKRETSKLKTILMREKFKKQKYFNEVMSVNPHSTVRPRYILDGRNSLGPKNLRMYGRPQPSCLWPIIEHRH